MLGFSEKVSDLLPHIRGGGADIESGIRWVLLRLRIHRCQMSLQIYAGRFGEVCSEPNERLLIVVRGLTSAMAAAAGVGAYGSAVRRGGPLLSGVASVRALSRSGAVSSRCVRGPPSAGKRFRSVAIIDV